MRKQKRKLQLNLGTIIVLLILFYVIVNMISFAFRTRMTTYEVKSGQMSDVISTTGLIVRDETVVKAEKSGNKNCYIPDLAKVYKGEIVYSLDPNGEIRTFISEESAQNKETSEENIQKVNSIIADFKENYDCVNFDEVYVLKQKLDNTVLNLNEECLQNALKKIESQYGKNAYQLMRSPSNGVLSYTYDNFTVKDMDKLGRADFQQSKYKKQHVAVGNEVKKGDPVYRIVNQDNWNIVVLLSEKEYEKMKERREVTVTFLKDDISTVANVTTVKKGKEYFAYLSLSKYMIAYINDRFLGIDISLNTERGYMIPKTAVAKHEFYEVPADYKFETKIENNYEVLAKEPEEKGTAQKNYNIYMFEEDQDQYYYLDTFQVPEGTQIYPADENQGNKIIQLNKSMVVKKKGVYYTHNGYTKFRPIEILAEEENYYLISANTRNGISMYDQIIQDCENVDTNQIIYEK